MNIQDLMEKAIKFHGHSCPGLALGVSVSKYILKHGNDFSIDEELVAVVENDNCSVDAIQALLGTTFGKGNFIFLDYGKNAYSFYNRTKQKALRISLKPGILRRNNLSKEEIIQKILETDPENIFDIQTIEFDPPEMARLHESIICDNCEEPTMSSRIKQFKNKNFCIPCYEALRNSN